MSGDNATQADAIDFTSGTTNSLTLDTTAANGGLSGNLGLGGTVTITPDTGGTTLTSVIHNYSGSTTGSLVKAGAGTLTLSAANTYTGGTTLNDGTLELGQLTSAGTGGIAFAAGAQVLRLDVNGTLNNIVTTFSNDGDTFDFRALSAAGATASYANGKLTVTNTAAQSDTVTVNAAPDGFRYAASVDGAGGTQVSLVALPTYTIGEAPLSGSEGNPGAGTTFTYTVTRTGDASQAGTVDLSLGGSATPPGQAGADYSVASGTGTYTSTGSGSTGTLAFAAGQATATFVLTSTPDSTYESNETATATLTGVATGGGTLGNTTSATATIVNDDAPPTLSVANASVTEGNSGTTNLVFNVSLSQASGLNTTVNYATADGTATAGSDYTSTSGSLTILAGQTGGQVLVPVQGDSIYEGDEALFLNLSNPTNATLANSQGTGAITNDDAPPTLAIGPSSVSQPEGNSGATPFVYTVTRTGDAQANETVNYAVTGSGANPASALDFTGGVLPSGTVTFAQGDTSKTITVPVAGDTTVEPNEGFTVTLSGPNFGTITQATATGIIQNDDVAPDQGGSSGPSTTPTPGPDYLVGTAGDDTIAALAGDDTINGGGGNDLLLGNQGNDQITDGDGQNTVYGGMDNDQITVGNGSNLLFGNEGSDTIQAGNGSNTIVGGQDSTDGADLITSGSGNDLILGNGGDDTVAAGGGADTVVGGFGRDILLGNQGDDIILGNQGDDTLFGGQGADTLVGGQGNDVLYGNEGDDVLYGNEGLNTFVFYPGDTDFKSNLSTGDTIMDFATGTSRVDFASGPTGTAANFGATSTTSTDFASIQALAQTLINGGDTYAFVADGTDGFLFTTGGSGTAITDAVKLTGAGSPGAVKYQDIAHGPLA